MKKLISALTVKKAHKDGLKELEAPSKTVMYTPEAISVAKELGIRLVDSSDSASVRPVVAMGTKMQISEQLVRSVVEKVIDRLPPEKRQLDVIKNVVVDVLAEYAK